MSSASSRSGGICRLSPISEGNSASLSEDDADAVRQADLYSERYNSRILPVPGITPGETTQIPRRVVSLPVDATSSIKTSPRDLPKKKRKRRSTSGVGYSQNYVTNDDQFLESFPAFSPSPVKTKAPSNGAYEVPSSVTRYQGKALPTSHRNLPSYQTCAAPSKVDFEEHLDKRSWASYLVLGVSIILAVVWVLIAVL